MPTASPEPVLRPVRPGVGGVREVLAAHFPAGSHAYPMHAHDAWTLMLVDEGAVAYHLGRAEHLARTAAVTLLPPDVPHDGRAVDARGFRKRVVYLAPTALDGIPLDQVLASPFRRDPALVREVAAVHAALTTAATGADRLDAECRLALLRERLVSSWGGPVAGDPGPDASLAARLRELLDAAVVDGVALGAAAAKLGSSPPSLVRAFSREVGMSPHRYLVSRRLDLARSLLLEGSSAAAAAAEAGFFDQAHLTRHFRRYLGVTPGRYAAAHRSLTRAAAAPRPARRS